MRRASKLSATLLCLACGGQRSASPLPTPQTASNTRQALAASELITEEFTRKSLSVISDDSMGGRNTPSPGLEKAAQYIAAQYQSFGLKPAGDQGTFYQRYRVVSRRDTASRATAPNVVAVVVGSDPILRNEYLLFSAHMDHVGTAGDGVGGCRMLTHTDGKLDSICNGADDNGTGTVALVAIAKAFSSLKPHPKRSILFVNVSGEEKGLLGSAWFADHPTVPLASIIANINIDMIGENRPDTLLVLGRTYSDLGETLARVEAAHPELHIVASHESWPTDSFFKRTDHYSFFKKSIPVISFYGGTHPEYHRPDDEIGLVNFRKVTNSARLLFYFALEVANTSRRPQLDTAMTVFHNTTASPTLRP